MSASNIDPTELRKLLELAECRTAFVKYITDEQAHREPWFRMSIKAHRKGKQHGFDHPGLQLKWLDYKAGWVARRDAAIGEVMPC